MSMTASMTQGIQATTTIFADGDDAAGGLEADDHSGDSDVSLGSPMSQHGTPQQPPGMSKPFYPCMCLLLQIPNDPS